MPVLPPHPLRTPVGMCLKKIGCAVTFQSVSPKKNNILSQPLCEYLHQQNKQVFSNLGFLLFSLL